MSYICGDMHFISGNRINPKTQNMERYYRIKESYRNHLGRVCCRVMLNIGFLEEPYRPEEIRDMGKCRRCGMAQAKTL